MYSGIISKSSPLVALAIMCLVVANGKPSEISQIPLGALHAGLLFSPGLLAHKELRGHFRVILAGVIVLGSLCFYVHAWLLAAWLCLLAGIELGKVLASHGMLQRLASTTLVILCMILVYFFLIPSALDLREFNGLAGLRNMIAIAYAIWACIYVMSWFEHGKAQAEPISSLLFFLLGCVMALSVAIATLVNPGIDYLVIVLMVICAGIALALVTWILWSPSIGGGLSTVFFRHMLSLSVPFDVWMRTMTEMADASSDADTFWLEAMKALLQRPGLAGISWQGKNGLVLIGEEGPQVTHLPLPEHGIHLHSYRKILPTMSFNLWLLARVALEFRLSKEREARLSAEATMRSVHELGARTTHDIKNLLHVINLLFAPGKSSGGLEFSEKKIDQLRSLAGRLESSLSQLKGQSLDMVQGGLVPAKTWWESARQRHNHANVDFELAPQASELDFEVPPDLFDRALENLLHNALRKQGLEGELHIKVELGPEPSLAVRDDGSPIAESVQDQLFNTPLPSSEGMGIGLFQLAMNCTKNGYEIFVEANSLGDVAFRLVKMPESQSSSSAR